MNTHSPEQATIDRLINAPNHVLRESLLILESLNNIIGPPTQTQSPTQRGQRPSFESTLLKLINDYNRVNRLFIEHPSLYATLPVYNNTMYTLVELFKYERTATNNANVPQTNAIPVPNNANVTPPYFTFEFPLNLNQPRGLSNAQIEQNIDKIPYDSMSMNESQCPISMENFIEGENICRIQSCRHIFKEQGLMSWLQNHLNCPVCRQPICLTAPPPSTDDDISQLLQTILRNLIPQSNDSFSINLNP